MLPSLELDLLSRVIEDIASELNLDALLALILERACVLTGADDGTIGLYDGAQRVIRTAAVYHMPASELGSVMKLGEGLAGRVLQTGKTFVGRYGDLHQINQPALANNFVAGVPVRWRNVLLGVFGIGVALPKQFSERDMALLELLARHAAVAIHNAQRYHEERHRAARFELIAKVAGIIQQGGPLMNMLQNTADAIHALMHFENVDIPLIDEQQPNTLVISVRGGSYKRQIRRTDRVSTALGIMGAAVTERRTQLVNDVAADSRYVNPPGVQPPIAELAVPIVHSGVVVGVLNVEGNKPFTEFDQQSLEVIANQIGLAITNARLNQQAQASVVIAERQRLASELHDNVTQLVSSISLLTQSLPQSYRRQPEEGERRAHRIHALAQTAYAELRALLRELSPPTHDDHQISRQSKAILSVERLREGGLARALDALLPTMIPETIQLELRFDAYVAQHSSYEEALYRVCQEAVSNVVRHASAKCIEVEARVSKTIVLLKISDDGCGMDSSHRQGMGLNTMRARVVALGGVMRVVKREPHGLQLEAALPRKDRTP